LIKKFFNNNLNIIKKTVKKISNIVNILTNHNKYRIYSSSLLIIHDHQNVVVKIIDFAHTFILKDEINDDGVLFGLQNFISILNHLLQHKSQS